MEFIRYAVRYSEGLIDNFRTFYSEKEAKEFYEKVKLKYPIAQLMLILDE